MPTPRLRPLGAALLASVALSCGASYPRERVPQAVADIMAKEYKLPAEGFLAGRTLYVMAESEAMVRLGTSDQEKELKKLDGLMLTAIRVAMSSDAGIRFTVVGLRDAGTGLTILLIRYVPDVHALYSMRMGRTDFFNRLVFELKKDPDALRWDDRRDIDMPEFIARLVSARVQRQMTENPLLGVLADVGSLEASLEAGVLTLVLERGDAEDAPWLDPASGGPGGTFLDRLIARAVVDAADAYGKKTALHEARLLGAGGKEIWRRSLEDLRPLVREAEEG